MEEMFDIVKTITQIEGFMDVDPVKTFSNQDLAFSFKIAHIEDQLNSPSNEASKHRLKEQEVLRE